jgi:sugar phosphate isomerase/epimerase
MDVGVSTACFFPLETEKALSKLILMGFKTFEVFINTESEYSSEYIKKMRSQLENNNANAYSFHFHTSGFEHTMFFSDYLGRFVDSVDQYARYFYAANEIGAKVAVFHGGKAGMVNLERYSERFWILSQKAKEYGIILTLENVNLYCGEAPEFISALRHKIGDGKIKFTLDIKQAIRAGISINQMLDTMGSDLINLHINDNKLPLNCLLPGKGNINYLELKNKLEEIKYQGPLIIEVYRNNFDNDDEIFNSYQYLKSIF